MNNPYEIIFHRRVTEKAQVLANLVHAKSNRSVSRCQTPKAVFDVHPKANKVQIAAAIEKIYADKKVKVMAVNTINVPSKKRRVRGFAGRTSSSKKAIVTFRPGDTIDETV